MSGEDFAVAFFAVAFFAGGLFAGAFLAGGLFAGAFLAVAFFAVAFFAVGFFAVAFFAGALFAVAFFAGALFAVAFFAGALFAGGFVCFAFFFAIFFGIRVAYIMAEHVPLDSAVHHCVLATIAREAYAPTVAEIARDAGVVPRDVEASLARLVENHGLVLHRDRFDVRIAHPFALYPTGVWVVGGERGWWAPCMWCAMGVASIVARDVVIHARLGAEAESLVLHVRDGEPADADLVVHFAIAPRAAWDDVTFFCSTVLPFRSDRDIDAWCDRHRMPRGESVPIRQVGDLARRWYGRHLAKDWVKWSVPEAQAIFERAGLTGPFWQLDARAARY